MKLLDYLKPGKIYLIETGVGGQDYDGDIIQVTGANKFKLLASMMDWMGRNDSDINALYGGIDYPNGTLQLQIKEITVSEFPLYMNWAYIAPEFYKRTV
jgi:hypothetical protein